MKNERNKNVYNNHGDNKNQYKYKNQNSNSNNYDENESNNSMNRSQDSYLQSDSSVGSNSVSLSNPNDFLCMDFTVDLDVASDRKGKYQILTKMVKTVKTVIINLPTRLF